MSVITTGLAKLERMVHPLLRDFTESAESRLIALANEVDDSDSPWDQYITDPLGRWLDKKGYLYLLKYTIDYQRAIIDSYNYNCEAIKKVFSQARSSDSSYGGKIAAYEEQGRLGALLLSELADCLDSSSTRYSDVAIEDRIMRFNSRWIPGEEVLVSDVNSSLSSYSWQNQPYIISNEDIEDFCGQSDAASAFTEYADYFVDEIDYGLFEGAQVVIFQGVNIAKDEAIGIFTGEGYEQKLIKTLLSGILNTALETEDTYASIGKDMKYPKEVLIDFLKKYRSGEKEAFEKEYPNYEYSTWESFVQVAGGADAIEKIIEDYPELLDYLLNDYTKGLELLNSLETLSGENISPEMQAAIESLKKEYDNKWVGIFNRVADGGLEFTMDQGISALKKQIKKEFPAYENITTLVEITGVQDKTEMYCKLGTLLNIHKETTVAYEAAIEKIRSGEYEESDLKTVESLFNMLKSTNIEMYKTYRDACADDPLKQTQLNEQIQKIQKMTIRDYK